MASNKEIPNGTLDGQVEDLLSLVLARTRGEVGNDAIENALDDLVANHAPTSSGGAKDKTTGRTSKQLNKDIIIPDEDNYDDDSEDDTKSISATTSSNKTKPTSKKVANKKSKRERGEALENIPLGKMGERMLITFGDGSCPNLEVISAALLGTRATLQRSILDARALRRKLKDNWHQARAAATMHRGTYASNNEMKKTTSGKSALPLYAVVDSELSFRALDGNGDGIRYDVSCGFDVPQLETLFPEEMNAYQRWKKMHDAYSDKSGEVEVPKKSEEDLTSDNNKGDELESDNSKIISGRLVERLANFDARTNKMGEDWYMNFANVRKGSFLPRAGGRKKNVETDEWKDRGKKRGRPTTKARTSWQKLSPTSVIFLHWIGFDPISALSPPNEETTHALGYLAYDFFGKIIEKAVSLRLESDKKSGDKKQKSRSDGPLLELTGGDQLEKEDIEQAMSEVNLNSLYSSSNVDLGQSAKVTQLYFGKGFEDRLELEMDELFGSKEKSLSSEEMKVRKEEEDLFSTLPAVPTLLSSVSTLHEISTPEENDTKEPASTAKKPRRAVV